MPGDDGMNDRLTLRPLEALDEGQESDVAGSAA
jgi:hypothetical protein